MKEVNDLREGEDFLGFMIISSTWINQNDVNNSLGSGSTKNGNKNEPINKE